MVVTQEIREAARCLLKLMAQEAPALHHAFLHYQPFVNCRPGWQEWVPFPSFRTPQAEQFIPLLNAACKLCRVDRDERHLVFLTARALKDEQVIWAIRGE